MTACRRRDYSIIGLGSGRAATALVKSLGKLIELKNLHIVGIPTSLQIKLTAEKVGIPLVDADQVDHIDTVKNNNHIGNLRDANGRNAQNVGLRSDSKTGLKGVSFHNGQLKATIASSLQNGFDPSMRHSRVLSQQLNMSAQIFI